MSKNIYCIGICGSGMGALAGLLKAQGHQVRGSDEHIYPPMSTKLREWGIEVLSGYDPAHLTPTPDLVVVGNVIRAHNPEAEAVRRLQLPTLSMPQAVAQFGIGKRRSIVIAGTHGKTTTTALAAHLLLHAGRDPSFLVGGALVGYPESFRHGQGPDFVVEGDEYDTAYFDKGPKFIHYRAQTAIITSLEFDHADIFASIEAVEAAFARLIDSVAADGHLVIWHGAERARALLARQRPSARVTLYASRPTPDAELFCSDYATGPAGLTFSPVWCGQELGEMTVPLWGDFSVCNALAALAAVGEAALTPAELAAGFASFAGVRRRMEVRGTFGGVVLVDDFAHHPTAVRVTLAAARSRWPGQRIWAIFEPRSATSRRNIFQDAYRRAFAHADRVILASHPRLHEIPAAERFDPEALARALSAESVTAVCIPDAAAIAVHVSAAARPCDVVMVLSNGDFDGLHGRLEAALGAPAG